MNISENGEKRLISACFPLMATCKGKLLHVTLRYDCISLGKVYFHPMWLELYTDIPSMV